MYDEGNYKQGEKAASRIEENSSKQNNWQRINLQNQSEESLEKWWICEHL